jgi:hypothetical protein
MSKRGKCVGYRALDPFFAIIQEGLTGLADGEHFFDTFAEDPIFESLYEFSGWPVGCQPGRLRRSLSAGRSWPDGGPGVLVFRWA